MNKYLLSLSLTGIMLVTACSSDEMAQDVPQLTPEEQAAIIAEACSDSDVPIVLGMGSSQSAGSITTRAPLNSDANGQFHTPDGEYIGVFCLAQQRLMPAGSSGVPGPVDNPLWDGTTTLGVRLNNQPAKVVQRTSGQKIGNIIDLAENSSEVLLWDTSSDQQFHSYYPYGNWYSYFFYAYYPWAASGVTSGANTITTAVTVDGKTDIIWGKASSEEAAAYSAKYLRAKALANGGENTLADLPDLQLSHGLAQLQFYVRTTDENYFDNFVTTLGNDFKLKDLKVVGVPSSWTLTIADRTDTSNEGKLTYRGNAQSVSDIRILTNNDENPFATPVDVTKVEQYLGYIMMPTTAMLSEAHDSYSTINTNPWIKIELKAGDQEPTIDPIKVPLPTQIVGGQQVTGFLAGHKYKINLDLYIPREQNARAHLESWEAETVTEVDLQVGNN